MTIERAAALIVSGRRFLATCHVRPDADTLGSALGFAAALRSLGKDVTVFSHDGVPAYLRFLPGADGVVSRIPEGPFDATFVMDTAASALLPAGFPDRARHGVVVTVDHHYRFESFADVDVRDTSAAATAEVVAALLRACGVNELPSDAATPLYAALVADTGGFRYSATTAATLRLAAELVERGAKPDRVAYALFDDWSIERVGFLSDVLATLALRCEGRVALLFVARETVARHGDDDEMIEGLVNYARRIRGVEVAALLSEMRQEAGPATRVRVSLRASGAVDVSAIAAALGGGGHRAAAGATIIGTLEAAGRRVVEESQRALAR